VHDELPPTMGDSCGNLGDRDPCAYSLSTPSGDACSPRCVAPCTDMEVSWLDTLYK